MKKLLLVISFFILWATHPKAQSRDPFNAYADLQAPVETFRMTQFGNSSPSLYTGAMAYSVPIFTYSDPDFTIPLSLEYCFDGYRPSQYSGTVGFGWSLQCGGAITREVRGRPDDEDSGYWDNVQSELYTQYGNTVFLGSSLMRKPYMNNSGVLQYPSTMEISTVNHFDDMPTWNERDGDSYYTFGHYDTAADFFHFSAPGLSGDFLMLPDGSIKVFNSSVPSGDLMVSIPTEHIHTGTMPPSSLIVITDGKGYRYEFGGDKWNMEYVFTTKDGETTGTAVSWRLKRIIAPNGREVVFEFTSKPDRKVSIEHDFKPKYDYYYYIGPGNYGQGTGVFDSSSYLLKETNIWLPSAVKVDGNPIYCFYYNARGSLHNENSPACFNNPGSISLEGNNYPQEFTCTDSPRSLSNIRVYNYNGTTLRYLSFTKSYDYTDGHKMFLTGVDMGGMGKYAFSYNTYCNAPKNDTYQTDHWGFWNSATHDIDYEGCLLNGSTTYPGLYSQLPDSIKQADPLRTQFGALTHIQYPTGGSTDITYEQNRVRYVFDRGQGYAPEFHYPGASYVPGGCRVKRLINRSEELTDTVTFTYNANAAGESSGTLSAMPRYFLGVAATHRVLTFHRPTPFFNQIPYSYPNGIDYSFQTYTFSFEADFKMPRGAVVGYSHVQESHSNGSRILYVYSSEQDYPDHYAPTLIDYETDYLTYWYRFILSPNDFIVPNQNLGFSAQDYACMLLPPLQDYSCLRGHLISRQEYDADGHLVISDSYEYAPVVAVRDTIASNLIVAYALHSDIHYEPRLVHRSESRYGIETSYDYTYNSAGQLFIRRTNYADGTVDASYTWYQSSPHGVNNSLRSAPSMITRGRSPAGSNLWHILDVTEYDYDETNHNPNPTSVKVSRSVTPEEVIPIPPNFHGVPSGYTSRTASFLYHSDNYRLKRASLPGQNHYYYNWDDAGRHYLIKAHGDTTLNKWTYTWMDQCGPAAVIEPTGVQTRYAYDSYGRLSGVYDADMNPMVTYSVDMATQSTPPVNGQALSRIATKTYLSEDGEDCIQDVDWYGGLGYLVQKTQCEASASSGHDLVIPVIYDAFHRNDATVFLPYAANQTGGGYVTGAIAAQHSWYASTDDHPLKEKTYEPSPSGRLLTITREGGAHRNAGRSINLEYGLNQAADSVLKLTYTGGTVSANKTVSASGTYPGNTLQRIRTIDEDGDTTYVFKDCRGKAILERRINRGVKMDTYTVRDIRDSIVCIVQPEGAAKLADGSVTSFDLSGDFASRWCFTFVYDNWGDIVREGTPGAGYVDRTFDSMGHITTEQDRSLAGVTGMRQYVYDKRGELLYLYYSRSQGTNAPYTALANTYWKSNTNSSGFTPVAGVVSSGDLCTNQCIGLIFKEEIKESPIKNGSVHGAPPGGVSITRQHYYGKKGRLIQTRESRSDGAVSLYSYKYDFSGRIIISDERHTAANTTHYKRESTTYDDRSRVLSRSVTMDGTTIVVLYSYDELGRQISTSVNGTLTESYSYDIHGWLTRHSVSAGSANPQLLYNQEYQYETAASPRYGGNLAHMSTFISGNDTLYQAFSYDAADRLVNSTIISGNTSAGAEAVAYDRNGNISALYRTLPGGIGNTLTFVRNGNLPVSVSDASEQSPWAYAFNDDGKLTSDGRVGRNMNYHGNGTPMVISDASNALVARYHILEDGTVFSVIKSDGSGIKYRGSFTYKVNTAGVESLESVSFNGGRFIKSGGVTAPLKPMFYVTDRLGSTAMIVDLSQTASGGVSCIKEKNYYLPYGTPITLTSFSTNRWRYSAKEDQTSVSTLPYLNFGARLYDPFLGSWTSADRLAAKTIDVSPYNYCADNPMKYYDSQGDSLAILKKGGNGMHLAMLIQNKKGKWEYYSINGNNVYVSGGFYGGRLDNDIAIAGFDNVISFLQGPFNTIGKNKEDKLSNKEVAGYDFIEAYVIPTTPQQDKKASQMFRIIANEKYSLSPIRPNHCSTAVELSLMAAGFTIGRLHYLPPFAYSNIQSKIPTGIILKKSQSSKESQR